MVYSIMVIMVTMETVAVAAMEGVDLMEGEDQLTLGNRNSFQDCFA